MKTYQTVQGHSLYYEDDAAHATEGISYLNSLPRDEARAFFNEASATGESSFQDRGGTRFALLYMGGQYLLNVKS